MAKFNDETIKMILKARESGLNQKECAEVAGINEATLYKWLKKTILLAIKEEKDKNKNREKEYKQKEYEIIEEYEKKKQHMKYKEKKKMI